MGAVPPNPLLQSLPAASPPQIYSYASVIASRYAHNVQFIICREFMKVSGFWPKILHQASLVLINIYILTVEQY